MAMHYSLAEIGLTSINKLILFSIVFCVLKLKGDYLYIVYMAANFLASLQFRTKRILKYPNSDTSSCMTKLRMT